VLGQEVDIAWPGVGKIERTHFVQAAPAFAYEDVDNGSDQRHKKFLREDAGHEKVTLSSAVAIEPDSKWKVIAEISGIAPDRKEVIVDDKDGNVVSYKQA